MKNSFFFALSMCAVVALTACKSQESAYRQAYEKAKQQETVAETTPVVVAPVQQDEVKVTPVTPAPQTVDADVRTIDAGMEVISGSPLKTYSVVCGSFSLKSNAEGLYNKLRNQGYDARLLRTNETIRGINPWYRVVGSSYDDKGQAVQSRTELRGTYNDAWLLLKR